MKVEEKNFSLVLFSALMGFLVANIFGTFLTTLRDYVVWDGFIIVGLIVFVETINLSVYKVCKSSPFTPSAFEEAGGILDTRDLPSSDSLNKNISSLFEKRRFPEAIALLIALAYVLFGTLKISFIKSKEFPFWGLCFASNAKGPRGRSLTISDASHRATLLNLPRRRNFLLCQLLNSFKLGLLLGFFVEAFKVGS